MKFNNDMFMLAHMGYLMKYGMESSFILELGTASGENSTSYLELALKLNDKPNKLFISVDCDETQQSYTPKVKYFHFVKGRTEEIETFNKVKEICGDRKADLIFIDTAHYYDQLKKEIKIYKELSNDSTVWLFHDTYDDGVGNEGKKKEDIGFYNSMTDAIKEYSEKIGWHFNNDIQYSKGLGILTRY